MTQRDVTARGFRLWIKRSWTRLWWFAIDPDEALALFDTSTVQARAWTRERLIEKLRARANAAYEEEWGTSLP
jgi:hypothetical protein